MSAYVYILASKPRGTLYVGVTNDLVRRVWEHREGSVAGFTKKYGVKMLVYYEAHATIPLAIQREKEHQALGARVETRANRGNESEMG